MFGLATIKLAQISVLYNLNDISNSLNIWKLIFIIITDRNINLVIQNIRDNYLITILLYYFIVLLSITEIILLSRADIVQRNLK